MQRAIIEKNDAMIVNWSQNWLSARDKRIIWIDCEMTGLRRKDKIVEIACVVTEADLSVS